MKNTRKQPKKKTSPKEEVPLTKEEFTRLLTKVITTVKVPKSPAKGKKGTSE